MKARILRLSVSAISLGAFALLGITSGKAQSNNSSGTAGGGCCGSGVADNATSGGSTTPSSNSNSASNANSSSSSGDLTPIGAPYHSAGCSYARGSNGQYDPNAPNAIHLSDDGTNVTSYTCLSGSFGCPTEIAPTAAQQAAGCGD